MNERLLQFIWQFQYYNGKELSLFSGEKIQILQPGLLNSQQGPDFLNARIQIGRTLFAGNVELHLKTSDWRRHRHHKDRNYKNVILHVVWEHDGVRPGKIPLLILQGRVSHFLLDQYETWMMRPSFIPCGARIATIDELTWQAWKARLLIDRLIHKSAALRDYLKENKQHWEESFWWLMARHFGLTVNAGAFEAMAKTIPVKLLSKHKSHLQQLEALLFGQAGMLNRKFRESYPKSLRAEYSFQQKKYKLKQVSQPFFFLRMRPVAFPTIRLAQLANLIHQSSHLFSEIKEITELKLVKLKLNVTASSYWDHHYRFDEKSAYAPKHLGDQMLNSLVINVICTSLFAWGMVMGEEPSREKAIRWLEETPAEKNRITSGFAQLGINASNACDSQALIELKTLYCDEKRCLDCAVGVALLKDLRQ